jgi:hypothetical protein
VREEEITKDLPESNPRSLAWLRSEQAIPAIPVRPDRALPTPLQANDQTNRRNFSLQIILESGQQFVKPELAAIHNFTIKSLICLNNLKPIKAPAKSGVLI